MSTATHDLIVAVPLSRRELDALEATAGDVTSPAWVRRVALEALDRESVRHELQIERLHETVLEWQKAIYDRLAALDHGKLVNTHDPKARPASGSPIAVLSLLLVSLACVAGSVAMTLWERDCPLTMGLLGVSAVLGGVAFVLWLRPPQPRAKARTPKPRTEEDIAAAVAAAKKEVDAIVTQRAAEDEADEDWLYNQAWAEVTFRTLAMHMQFISAYAEQQALGKALEDTERMEADITRVVDKRLGVSHDVWRQPKWGTGTDKGETPDREGRGR